ncbi:DUF4097 domain-containing protein [Nonomuraea gerenzanensis]|uniref:Lipoprotein n=1 Tax=Nonomuraea gerenzanensis TaxID=93944 RepID=A0A1M4EP65_9ACTN|nr:DUF4097 domain-containing protein [Nonomuraea gerenzanensis]UBU12129.1 DUF4097 domain-containing protein [Nonomuraea gerenzanensis]SBP00646.1 lipoprotein [Nonomuraea gerenzanensis]
MRALWLAAGAVATVVALTLSTVALWQGFGEARTPTDVTMRSIPFDGRELRIQAGKGQVDLMILSGRAGELLIQRALRWTRDRPTVTEDWDAASGTLRLDAVCPGHDQPRGPICRADYVVQVPPETTLEAGTSGGRLRVDDLFGDLRLTTVSGDVRVNALAGDLWVRTGTGHVQGDGLRSARADVEVGSGDVQLAFRSAPSEVKAIVRTAGDIDLYVPPNLYDVTAEGANTTLDVRRASGASRKVTVRAPEGLVSVCCR